MPFSPTSRIALYCRVSTDDQTAANQEAQLREWLARTAPGATITHVYTETASGADKQRPEFKAMLEDARRRKFDLLVFWSLDRLTRSGVVHAVSTLEQLTAAGVAFKSYQESFLDTAGPFGQALTALIAAMAQMELQRIQERTKAGLARARLEGKTLGRPKAEIPPQALQMAAEGYKLRHVARVCDVNEATLRRHLARLRAV